jgi:riboflavin kinase/FMN adenylyltransferase
MKTFAGAQAFADDVHAAGEPGPLAVAIGNFDGVHLGHRRLLDEARARAARAGGGARSAVLTFTPHPARLFAPERAPSLIQSLERRLELCAQIGIDIAIVQPFTREFAAVPADDFVREVLARTLRARDVIVGYDFSFGRGRAGDVRRLAELGRELGLGIEVVPPVAVDGVTCSSTAIRRLVGEGRVVEAAALLGRPVEIQGVVVRGAGRGRGLGFPTANVRPDAELAPAVGIYAARARILDGPLAGQTRPAALSIGTNPTFTQTGTATIEAYLLDFDADLYDRSLRLEVVERLRDEEKFASIEALMAQIQRDVDRVRAIVC